MIDLSLYDYAVFDCDGVILDSNRLKTEAFAQALENEPEEYVDKMISYHKANGGVSRYKKFKHYFEEINTHENDGKNIEEAISRFSEIVYEGLMKCDYITGAVDFIKQVKEKGLQLFVVSGSDQEELREVFSKRGIASLFIAIYGSPFTKIENMNKVIAKVDAQKRGIFFGDSRSDLEAAEKFGLDFVFVKGVSEWREGDRLTRIKGFLTIKDFKEEACTEF